MLGYNNPHFFYQELSGIVQEVSEGSLILSAETYIVVKIYQSMNTGGFVTKTQVNTDGSFKKNDQD